MFPVLAEWAAKKVNLSQYGHDKKKCMPYNEDKLNTCVIEQYGLDTYACGLYQTGVPCMKHMPAPDEG